MDTHDIVIVGGGIMGCSTAYWISQLAPNETITIVEMEGIASSSSGKAGGFLARGWHGGGTMRQLHEVGFDLIEEFAQKYKLSSYRKLPMFSLRHQGNSHCTELPWLDSQRVTYSLDDPSTAQVTPKELTESFLKHAGPNVKTKIGFKVISVQMSEYEEAINSVTLVDLKSGISESMPCKALIICTGAWSSVISSWFPPGSIPCINMEGIKSSSFVYEHDLTCDDHERKELVQRLSNNPGVLFCEDDINGCHLEVYPRPNGDIYICGLGGSPQLSAAEIVDLLPRDVAPNKSRVELAHQCFMKMTSQTLDEGDARRDYPNHVTACLRPIMHDGLPVMGPLVNMEGEELKNVYLNAGHNCWGILWSAASGKVIAELVVEGKGKCISLKPFLPRRLVRRSKK